MIAHFYRDDGKRFWSYERERERERERTRERNGGIEKITYLEA
jgi:hypothetical protein